METDIKETVTRSLAHEPHNKYGIIVYAAGVFDILHKGHINYLKKAKSYGDTLFVGVLTDKASEAYKRKPYLTYDERKVVIENLKCVDFIIPQFDTDPTASLEYLKEIGCCPHILTRGSDFPGIPPGKLFMDLNNGCVITIPYDNTVSSTEIIKRIQSSEPVKESSWVNPA